MSAAQPTIIYTLTDEAPLLATYAFLPIIRAFTEPAGIDVKTSDISVAARILAEFGDYLANERGLVPATVHHPRRFARLFLTEVGVSGELGLAGLTAATVTSFTVSQATRRSPGDMRSLVSAVRSLLRFLHLTGHLVAPLASAVPTVPGWRFGSLPRGVGAGQVAAISASCDRDSAVGRPDHAVLMLLSRLGLRAGEVIGITLDDIDWRAGELRGGRQSRSVRETSVAHRRG